MSGARTACQRPLCLDSDQFPQRSEMTRSSSSGHQHVDTDQSSTPRRTQRVRAQRAPLTRRRAMGDAGVGWIAAIIIGGIAGWLAEQFMKSSMGLIMNIVLGIVGAAIASAILSYFGIALPGGLDRLPDFRLHWRGLADLDRSGRTASLRPSKARSKARKYCSPRFILHGDEVPRYARPHASLEAVELPG